MATLGADIASPVNKPRSVSRMFIMLLSVLLYQQMLDSLFFGERFSHVHYVNVHCVNGNFQ